MKKINKLNPNYVTGFIAIFLGTRYFSTPTENKNNIKPAAVYTNADTQRLDILKNNHKKSGIYRWINKETGKSYVGSANDLSKRFRIYYSLLTIEKF